MINFFDTKRDVFQFINPAHITKITDLGEVSPKTFQSAIYLGQECFVINHKNQNDHEAFMCLTIGEVNRANQK